jgi:hypothetical protein
MYLPEICPYFRLFSCFNHDVGLVLITFLQWAPSNTFDIYSLVTILFFSYIKSGFKKCLFKRQCRESFYPCFYFTKKHILVQTEIISNIPGVIHFHKWLPVCYSKERIDSLMYSSPGSWDSPVMNTYESQTVYKKTLPVPKSTM